MTSNSLQQELQKQYLLTDFITNEKLPSVDRRILSEGIRKKVRIKQILLEKLMYSLSKELNPDSKKFNVYFYLSRDFVSEVLNGGEYLKWVLGYDSLANLGGKGLNVITRPVLVHAIRLGRTSLVEMNELSIFTDLGLVCVEFVEFRQQSILAQNGIQFHHLLRHFKSSNSELTYTPFYSIRGWHRFREPINFPDSLTVGLWDYMGGTRINMSEQSISKTITAIKFESQIEFYVGGNRFPEYNGIVFPVIVSGFTSADPAVNAAVNSQHSLVFHDLTFLQLYILTLPILSSIPNGTYGTATLTYNCRRKISTHIQLICEIDEDDRIV